MKKIVLIVSTFVTTAVMAQDFPGIRTGSHAGVLGVFSNPANIADSRYKWHANLLSVNTGVGNTSGSFDLGDLGNTFSDGELMRRFVGQSGEGTSAMLNAGIYGPSVMFNVGPKSTIALSTRGRILMNAIDFDGRLANQLLYPEDRDFELPYEIRSGNSMRVNVNAWTEFGASFGHVLYNEGAHFLKGGVTLKYLAGVTNGYLGLNNLDARLDANGVSSNGELSNASGTLLMGFGGANLDQFSASDLTSFKSSGFGGDIGFVYEYRPESALETDALSSWRAQREKYKFRFGVSLMDLGKINYDRDNRRSGNYAIDIQGAEFVDLQELGNQGLDELNTYFASQPDLFTPIAQDGSTYKVGLPTTLQLDADYHIHEGFFVNLGGQVSLSNNDTKIYNSQYYSGVSLTPRFEGKRLGIYLPLSYNALTDFNAGFSIRYGPVFIGSGSLLTALIGNTKQVDAHFGISFGGLLD
ncbi:MAG: hypothetical protein EOO05_12320 [Chitinophagaceae bacterium]|nr:MAG: hypothetical protein EOO05_12320 [Chitinophagaceae bacterium]